MKKRWLITGALITAVLGLVTVTAMHDSSHDPQGADKTASAAANEAATGDAPVAMQGALDRLKTRAARLAKSRERGDVSNIGKVPGFSRDTLLLAQEVFNEMHAVRGLVHTHEMRAEAARDLLADPTGLELVYQTSTDPAFARKAFGDKQAEARHYAILTMEQAAKNGASDRLLDAIDHVSKTLKASDTLDSGQREDLRELLVAYASVLPSASLAPDTVQRLGYDHSLPRELKQVYYESVFSRIWQEEGLEAAQARFKEIFPKG